MLHWNESAIRFYTGLGAVPMDEWDVYRLSGDELDLGSRMTLAHSPALSAV